MKRDQIRPDAMADEGEVTAASLTLDGNALGGLLNEIFGVEMTAEPCRCAHCGNHAAVATLVAYTRAPGVVLRCSVCSQVVLRIVRTPHATYIDASGSSLIRLPTTD